MTDPSQQKYGDLTRIFEENDMWVKDSAEGSRGLCRGISSCLFLTEKLHEKIQHKLVYFFLQNYSKISFKFLRHYSEVELLERYVEHPHLTEFESVNLELAGYVFNRQCKLYFAIGHKFCCELYYCKTPKAIEIFKRSDNNYSAVFTKEIGDVATMCQSIVLRLVNRIFDSNIEPLTPGVGKFAFLNFDLEGWKRESGKFCSMSENVDLSQMPFEAAGSSYESSNRHEQNTHAQSVHREVSSVADDLIRLFKKRKRQGVDQEKEVEGLFLKSFVNPLDFIEVEAQKQDADSGQPRTVSKSLDSYVKRYLAERTRESTDIPTDAFKSVIEKLTKEAERQSNQSAYKSDDSKPYGRYGSYKEQKVSSTSNDAREQLASPDTTNYNGGSPSNSQQNFDWTNNQYSDNAESKQKPSLKQKLKGKRINQMEFVPHPSLINLLNVDNQNLERPRNRSNRAGRSEKEINGTPVVGSQGGGKQYKKTSKPDLDSGNQLSKDRYIETIDGVLYKGRLKFFDEKNGFGFMLLTENGVTQDLFVYKNEFERARVPLDLLRQVKNGLVLNFTFQIARYVTKGQQSKKAINIRMMKG